jgi:hypothetical protein
MAKATNRKHATHKKARAQHSAKTHTRRSSVSSSASVMNPVEINKDAEIVDDESTARPGPRSSEQDSDDELGIYSASRGESAGDSDEATS